MLSHNTSVKTTDRQRCQTVARQKPSRNPQHLEMPGCCTTFCMTSSVTNTRQITVVELGVFSINHPAVLHRQATISPVGICEELYPVVSQRIGNSLPGNRPVASAQ